MKPIRRFSLVIILTLVGSVLHFDSALGQPPGFPGGMPGNPGTNIGRPGGMPGMPGGMPGNPGVAPGGGWPGMPGGGGGVVGGPGMGAMGGRPPGMGAMGGGPPGMGGGLSAPVTIWQCPNCKREVGQGATPPAQVTCCGQTYINGKTTGGIGFINVPLPKPTTAQGPPPSAVYTPTSSGGTWKLVLVGVGVLAVGLAILGGVVMLIMKSQGSGGREPRRRRYRD